MDTRDKGILPFQLLRDPFSPPCNRFLASDGLHIFKHQPLGQHQVAPRLRGCWDTEGLNLETAQLRLEWGPRCSRKLASNSAFCTATAHCHFKAALAELHLLAGRLYNIKESSSKRLLRNMLHAFLQRRSEQNQSALTDHHWKI